MRCEISLYLIIAVHRLGVSQARNDSRFYIGASDIGGPGIALLRCREFARTAEPITAKPFPYRKPEAKESHVAPCVYVAALSVARPCVCACVRSACTLALTRQDGGAGGGEGY